jgi:hypothetical protein
LEPALAPEGGLAVGGRQPPWGTPRGPPLWRWSTTGRSRRWGSRRGRRPRRAPERRGLVARVGLEVGGRLRCLLGAVGEQDGAVVDDGERRRGQGVGEVHARCHAARGHPSDLARPRLGEPQVASGPVVIRAGAALGVRPPSSMKVAELVVAIDGTATSAITVIAPTAVSANPARRRDGLARCIRRVIDGWTSELRTRSRLRSDGEHDPSQVSWYRTIIMFVP